MELVQIQATTIFVLVITNGITLIVLAASRSDVSFRKQIANEEKAERYKYHDKLILCEEKLSKQNRLIRAMAINDGFTDPTDDE